MKSKHLLLFACLLNFACTNEPKHPEKETIEPIPESTPVEADPPESETTTIVPKEMVPVNKEDIYGLYVGSFEALDYKENKKPSYSNKITISIDSMTSHVAYGHSIVAGNQRPFKGTYEKTGVKFDLEVQEPGDDRYDGTFSFSVFSDTKKLAGYWWANDEKLAVTKREYFLEKRSFEYDPNLNLPEDVIFGDQLYNTYDEDTNEGEMITDIVLQFNASNTELKKEAIENMFQGDLEVIRNAIYARHGYSFKNRRMRYVFDRYVDWYIPLKTNILADLTDLEKQNIDLLKRYEKHAEKYYDSFGR